LLKKIISHSAIYGLAPQISKIASIFALPIITKDLTEVDFGVWGLLLAYTGIFEILFTLGLGLVLSNSFFQMPCQYKWLWRQIYGFLSLWAIPFSFFTFGIVYLILHQVISENLFLLLFLLLFPKTIFGPTILLGTFYFQLNQNPIPIAIRTGIIGLITVLLNVYTISYLKMGYMGWAWTSFIVAILMNISYWIPLNFRLGYSPIFNFKWQTIRNCFKISLPTIPHFYSVSLLYSSDRIVLERLDVNINSLGEYNLASQFGGYFRMIFGALNRAIGPMIYALYKEKKDRTVRDLIFFLQIIGLLGTFIFCLWSKEIFFILIKNETLGQTYPLAIIIIMSYNYRPMYIGSLSKIYFHEKTEILWKVSFIAGLSNVLLNIIFIPIFGFKTAAYTTFICLMYLGFYGFFIKKMNMYITVNYYPLFWLTLIILSTVLAYYMVELTCLFKLLISFTLFALILLLAIKNKTFLSFK